MLKKPVTKKLSEKNVLATVDKNSIPLKKLFDDEVFYQIPKYPNLFISQYARIIQTYKRAAPRLLSPHYEVETGYTKIVLTNAYGKRKCWCLHILVAMVWCEHPSFKIADELEVHHKIKVKSNLIMQPMEVNFAENLMYVYRKYHKLIDSIRGIKVATYSKNWKTVKSIEDIAKYYNVEEKDVYEFLIKKPNNKVNSYDYYDGKIGKQEVGIELRRYASKKKK